MRDKKQRKPLKALIPRPLLPSLGEGEPEPTAESLVLKKSSTWGDPKTGFSAAPSPKVVFSGILLLFCRSTRISGKMEQYSIDPRR